jgi:nitrite reductase/ring-hydroxylating ferredoxin subunit
MIWVMNSSLNAMKSTMRVAIDVLISTISCHFSTEGAKSDAFRSPLNLAVVYHPIIILLFRQTHVHATIKRCPHAGISRLERTPFHTADVL